MISYRCDGCRRELSTSDLRYTVTIDIRATYEDKHIGLLELVQDHRKELKSLIEQMKGQSAKDVEESVYKAIKLDLCPLCQRAFISDPLRFHPEQGIENENVDIDAFLKTLGYGESSQENSA